MSVIRRGRRVRAVPVSPGGWADLSGPDYADAFEMQLAREDPRTAEEWVRAGLEQAPLGVGPMIRMIHRHVLGFDLATSRSPGHILGWRVVHNEPGAVRLEAESDLARAVILAQRQQPSVVSLQTFLFYRQPTRARRVWAAVGPLHRALAPLLLSWAARGADQPIGRGRTLG